MAFHPVHALHKYRPSGPADCDQEQFLARLDICQTCEHRTSSTCGPARQLVTIQARRVTSHCPARKWPGDPPVADAAIVRVNLPLGAEVSSPPLEGGAGGVQATPDTAPRPTIPTPQRTTDNGQLTTAVVIISHNYGRYLTDAIHSVLNQTHPVQEILVVDDSSTDNTADVTRQFVDRQVRYVRIDARDVNAARYAGFSHTSADVLCFLDADDMLSADYIEQGLRQFAADPQVALVYSDWNYFQARSGRETFPPPDQANIAWRNFCHAASLVKRSSLITVNAFHNLPDMTACRHHCDWALWRKVLTGTRKAAKQCGLLFYRQHDSNWLQVAMTDRGTYYDRAALYLEPVTIVIPLSGRDPAWQDCRRWLERQTFERSQLRLVLIDTSQDDHFHFRLRMWVTDSSFPDVRILRRTVGDEGLANGDYRDPDTRRKVVRAMWQIYDDLPRLDTEYILTLEDDVVPPDDVIDRLMRRFDHDVFSVCSPYRGRWGHWMTWRVTGPCDTEPLTGLQPTTGNGFGCCLMRRSVLQRWAIGPYNGIPDYDMALYQRLKDEGQWKALVDWDCRSIHAGILPE